MKPSLHRITAVFLILMLSLALVLTSCNMSSPGTAGNPDSDPSTDVVGGTGEGAEPSPDEEDSDADTGDTVINQTVNQTINNVTVEGERGSIAYATAKGLRSAISVYCTFEKTTAGSSFWNPTPTTKTYYTTGSGVIWEADEEGNAFLVTNYHVVYDAESNTENGISDLIYVYLYGMEAEEYAIPATYVGGSAYYDIAVLRVDASSVLKNAVLAGSTAAISLGDSNAVVPGDTAIAIGNPSSTGLGGLSVTAGVISVDSEYIEMAASDGSGDVAFRVMRTDAPVNAGNSGGGLFDEKGNLIGIVNAKLTSTTIEGVGYAIPASVVRGVAKNIIDHCYGTDCERVMCATIGVTVKTSAYATVYDPETGLLYRTEEIRVAETTAGALADGVLLPGDVHVSVRIGEGEEVAILRRHHLIDAMLDARVGDTVTFTVLRDGVETALSIVITEDAITAR